MKYLLSLVLIILIVTACSESANKQLNLEHLPHKTARTFDFQWDAKSKQISEANFLLAKLKDSLTFEFFYPEKTPILENDTLIIVHQLKKRGFKIVKSGRGNWQEGPRVVSITMESDDFFCLVNKFYYSNGKDTSLLYKTSERIACLAK